MERNIDVVFADASGGKNNNFNLIYFYLFLILAVNRGGIC